mmetsp:Transcript_12693/g.15567  ORF Transcript_12693/g.15567 Transcript_12693/m.15567 type:complete len:1318 (-) Transcript_12693:43-3996(-)
MNSKTTTNRMDLTFLLSEDSTIPLGKSSESSEFEDLNLNEKVDLVATTFGQSPPIMPLREERMSLGVECVFKAKGVGWQGVRKKRKSEQINAQKKSNLFFPCNNYAMIWQCQPCIGMGRLESIDDDNDIIAPLYMERNRTSHELKALTYVEYLQYLRRCQEKMKSGDEYKYIEIEVDKQMEKDDSPLRRQRIYTSQLIEPKDQDNSIYDASIITKPLLYNKIELSSPKSPISISSLPSDCGQQIRNADGSIEKQQSKRQVSFASVDLVKTIPPRNEKSLEKVQDATASKKESVKDEMLDDIDVIIKALKEKELRKEQSQSTVTETISSSPIKVKSDMRTVASRRSTSTKATSNTDTHTLKKLDTAALAVVKAVKKSESKYEVTKTSAISSSPMKVNRQMKSATNRSSSQKKTDTNTLTASATPVVTARREVTSKKSIDAKSLQKSNEKSLKKNLMDSMYAGKGPTHPKKIKSNIPKKQKSSNILNITQNESRDDTDMDCNTDVPRETTIECRIEDLLDSQPKVSPLGKDPAVELTRRLMQDMKAMKETLEHDLEAILSKSSSGESKPSLPRPTVSEDTTTCSKDSDGIGGKVDTFTLHDHQAKRAIESKSLSKRLLDDMRSSLDEADDIISKASSYPSSQKDSISQPIQQHNENCVIPSENCDTTVAKMNSELQINQMRRSKESTDLAMRILDEVKSSLDEEEDFIIQSASPNINKVSSSESFNITPANIIAKQCLGEAKLLSPTKSLAARSSKEYRTIPTHPTELAKRRVKAIRARHEEVSISISKTTSQETEDSWGQPDSAHEEFNWLDENDSISSVEETSSASAESARIIIEQTRARLEHVRSMRSVTSNQGSTENSPIVSDDSDESKEVKNTAFTDTSSDGFKDEIKVETDVSSYDDTSGNSGDNLSSKSKQTLSDEIFQNSADLAKRLLQEAFLRQQQDRTRPNKTVEEHNVKNDDDVSSISIPQPLNETSKQHSIEMSRQIMNEAGFGDLFASKSESGSFEKMLREARINLNCTESESEIAKDNSKTLTLPPRNPPTNALLKSVSPTSSESSCTVKIQNIASPSSLHDTLEARSPQPLKTCASGTSAENSKTAEPMKFSFDIPTVEENTETEETHRVPSDTIITSPYSAISSVTMNIRASSPTALESDSSGVRIPMHEEFERLNYSIPKSFSVNSCCSNEFSIKSSKSFGDHSAIFEFGIEESISMTINELDRINSMLEDAESSCHSSQGLTERDALYFAKQSKEEIAALAMALEYRMKAEEDNSFETSTTPPVSESYSEESAMDELIEEVNFLCNQIEARIDNIVQDTQT